MVRILLLILSLFACTYANAGDIVALLTLDETIRTDSIYQWYKHDVRQLDSAKAMTILSSLEKRAAADDNQIALATTTYLKGLYFNTRLKNSDSAESYILKAIGIASRAELEYEWAIFTAQLGMLYFTTDRISNSIECLLRADEKFLQLGYERDKEAAVHLYNIGYVFYHLHNYKECLKYLHRASQYQNPKNWVSRQLPNTTALAYSKLGMYDSAFAIYNTLLQRAIQENDTQWIGTVSGNIGYIYIKNKEYAKALPFFEKNYQYLNFSKENDVTGNVVNALVSLADIYASLGDVDKAEIMLAYANAKWPMTAKWDYWRLGYLYQTTAKLNALNGNYEEAYKYLLKGKDIDDSITRRDDAQRYIYVQQQLETEKHMAGIKVLQEVQKTERLQRNFLIAAFLLTGIIGWMGINRYKLRVRKDIEIQDNKARLLASEKLRVEQDLSNARQLLHQYVQSIQEKNTLIEQIQQEFALKEDGKQMESEKYDYLQQLSDATLLTDDEWGRFKLLFEKVHSGFFIRLKTKLPDLTEAETRLLALLKLNIPNKQIAQMLGISPASVHTARYRLRKKITSSSEIILEELSMSV